MSENVLMDNVFGGYVCDFYVEMYDLFSLSLSIYVL